MKNKAAFIKAPYNILVKTIDIPEPVGNYVLVEVMACALCGGDISSAKNNKEYLPFGHEISGVVRKVGDKVNNVSLGDKVVIETTSFCGNCYHCRNGEVELCNDRKWFSDNEDGGFSQYVLAIDRNLVVFDSLSYKEASLIEPFAVAMDLVTVSDIRIDDHVLIVGLGSIGLMALQLLKYRTAASICGIVSSKSKSKIEVAKSLGIDDLCYYDLEDVKKHEYPVKKFDRILITSPPETIPDYIDLAAFGGVITYLGFGSNSNITFDSNQFHVNKLQLIASFASPGIYFPRCIELIKRGKIDLESLITHEFTMDNIVEEIACLKNDSTRLIKAVMYNTSEDV